MLTIRQATLADAPRLLEIYAPYVGETAISFEYAAPSLEEFQRRISSIMQRYPYVVAEENGRVWGYAYASAFKEREAFRMTVETSVYVDAACRQQGIGRQLYIALEEELIGINELQEKERLLDEIKPSYLVLKPSLHGGMQGTREWVELARQRGIGSWVTSALESNVGLHAIAHLTTQLYGNHIEMAQGLGTGLLYTDNIDMPLCIKGQEIWHK